MMKIYYFPFIILFLFTTTISAQSTPDKTIHVFVALCDNANQGIVPVPKLIGNGQDPHNNLYWGALYGIRTHFKKSGDWTLVKTYKNPKTNVLERCVFKHNQKNVYMVADAYDGAYIKQTTMNFLYASAGRNASSITYNGIKIPINGGANLVAYIGHNGLMDFTLQNANIKKAEGSSEKEVVILGCISKPYFTEVLQQTKANPLIWTTGLMAPEAYTLEAILKGWLNGESDNKVRERAAAAYHKYQKCGMRGARNLLVTGF